MTTKTNQLAVIDELIAVPVIECQDDQLFVDAAKAARAAVAELVEAANQARKALPVLRAILSAHKIGTEDVAESLDIRLSSALAAFEVAP